MSRRHYVTEDRKVSANTHLVKWWFKTFYLRYGNSGLYTYTNNQSQFPYWELAFSYFGNCFFCESDTEINMAPID